MSKKKLAVVFVLFACSITSNASADVTGTGLGGTIPENNIAGITSTINIAQNQLITGNLRVTIRGLVHTYVGDVIATLSGPDGTTVTLFNRIGRVTTGFGDSSNFNGTYTFLDTPVNANGVNIWTEATLGTSAYNLRSGQYRATNANASTAAFISTSFLGKSTLGNWRLRISDVAATDTGTFANWSISMSSMTTVPEPVAIMPLAILGFLGIFRKRQSRTAS